MLLHGVNDTDDHEKSLPIRPRPTAMYRVGADHLYVRKVVLKCTVHWSLSIKCFIVRHGWREVLCSSQARARRQASLPVALG